MVPSTWTLTGGVAALNGGNADASSWSNASFDDVRVGPASGGMTVANRSPRCPAGPRRRRPGAQRHDGEQGRAAAPRDLPIAE